MSQTWQTDLYQNKHSFVWQLGQGVVDLLNPQPGERILDLGCGTGQLSQEIANRGAIVVGLDADAAMVAEAQRNFPSPTFAVADAREFLLDEPVDAILSNAVFHWIDDPVAVAKHMWLALKPGGRLAVEFGGKGNVATITAAIADAYRKLGYGAVSMPSWYFPPIGEYTSLLERQGFEVQLASLRDRPTLLEGESGLINWLKMFAGRFGADLSPDEQQRLFEETATKARSALYKNGQWWADYRRIQVLARKL